MGVSVISAEESQQVKDNLMIGLAEFWKGTDGVLSMTNKRATEAIIWQTIDDEDNAFLADLMVQAGMRVPAAAAVVRALANSAYQLRLGGILVPRFWQTWQFYMANGFAVNLGGPRS